MRDTARAGRPCGQSVTGAASEWVARFYAGIRQGGQVLDVACGAGRHFPLGLQAGNRIVGIDRDLAAARQRWSGEAAVTLIEADLETGAPVPFAGQTFDGVVVTNYLWRPILPEIVAAVAADGLLIYETFGVGQERLGRPSRPEFLLRRGELLEAVQPALRVVAFEHAHQADPWRIVQRIAAVGPLHPWWTTDTPAATAGAGAA